MPTEPLKDITKARSRGMRRIEGSDSDFSSFEQVAEDCWARMLSLKNTTPLQGIFVSNTASVPVSAADRLTPHVGLLAVEKKNTVGMSEEALDWALKLYVHHDPASEPIIASFGPSSAGRHRENRQTWNRRQMTADLSAAFRSDDPPHHVDVSCEAGVLNIKPFTMSAKTLPSDLLEHLQERETRFGLEDEQMFSVLRDTRRNVFGRSRVLGHASEFTRDPSEHVMIGAMRNSSNVEETIKLSDRYPDMFGHNRPWSSASAVKVPRRSEMTQWRCVDLIVDDQRLSSQQRDRMVLHELLSALGTDLDHVSGPVDSRDQQTGRLTRPWRELSSDERESQICNVIATQRGSDTPVLLSLYEGDLLFINPFINPGRISGS